jgi:hypothetical protein
LFTFFDALRVYTTARHFIDALGSNPDDFLPSSRTPSIFSTSRHSVDTEVDPLAAHPIGAPLLPTPPALSEGGSESLSMAIETINDFVAILSVFGNRFGTLSGVSWRDRFQKESQNLLTQLQSKLQHQQSSVVFWSQGPVTPNNLALSPRRSAGFYPSPATTQYSPGYVPQEPDTSPMMTTWSINPQPPTNYHPHPFSASSSIDLGPVPASNEFGIPPFAAWETLPGGSLNPRFG